MTAFNPKHIKRDILNMLVRKSKILEINGDDKAYSHIAGFIQRNPKGLAQSQYNKVKALDASIRTGNLQDMDKNEI